MTQCSLDFSYAYSRPTQLVQFRSEVGDFIVDEVFQPEVSGGGEHFWLKIKKMGENTDWVAGKLANYFSVRKMDVGYAGKKDRHAITTQWFSVYLPGKPHVIDWPAFIESSGLNAELIESRSHSHKLKKGAHDANHFRIRLRGVSSPAECEERLNAIANAGVPNYFGEQRFGREAQNLIKAEKWVQDPRSVRDRNLRGLFISAARSYLFNMVLSRRVADGSWKTRMAGEPFSDVTGPLWGRGRNLAVDAQGVLEEAVLSEHASWCAALENVGLSQERRSLILQPQNLSWTFEKSDLLIAMTLEAGQFATSVLRELAYLDSKNSR